MSRCKICDFNLQTGTGPDMYHNGTHTVTVGVNELCVHCDTETKLLQELYPEEGAIEILDEDYDRIEPSLPIQRVLFE